MNVAKVLFTVAVAAFYAAWLTLLGAVWGALPPWGFALALALYLPPSTWLLFLAGMGIERAVKNGALPELPTYLVKLVWPFAAVHNALNNSVTMTIICVDLPRELATTKRMNRYADGPEGWRKRFALFVRQQLLDWADPDGYHV
jgi:hypothetical protein